VPDGVVVGGVFVVGGVVVVLGVIVDELSIVVVLALSVALPLIVRVLLSDDVVLLGVSDAVSELCVLAQAAVRTRVDATARP
jgi:hypothetical protein